MLSKHERHFVGTTRKNEEQGEKEDELYVLPKEEKTR